jgi:CheY-like chemotaxis protein
MYVFMQASWVMTMEDAPAPRRKAMRNSKILIVDDDPALGLGLKLRLRANHYDTVDAVDGFSGIALAYKELPNLIILDLGLPAGNGFEVLSHLERDDKLSSIPVIVLTARDLPRVLASANRNFYEHTDGSCYATVFFGCNLPRCPPGFC